MRVRFLRSFDRDLESLSPRLQDKVQAAVSRLLDYFKGGRKPMGLGLRLLHRPHWEIRVSLDLRVVFSLEGDAASFELIGGHDAVRRFLDRS